MRIRDETGRLRVVFAKSMAVEVRVAKPTLSRQPISRSLNQQVTERRSGKRTVTEKEPGREESESVWKSSPFS